MTVLAKERYDEEVKEGMPADERFSGISLRPGTLTDEQSGKVKVGKIGVGGTTSRATVAEAIVATLETTGAKGWVDIIDGEDDVKKAIQDLTDKGIDSVDEEDWETMKTNATKF